MYISPPPQQATYFPVTKNILFFLSWSPKFVTELQRYLPGKKRGEGGWSKREKVLDTPRLIWGGFMRVITQQVTLCTREGFPSPACKSPALPGFYCPIKLVGYKSKPIQRKRKKPPKCYAGEPSIGYSLLIFFLPRNVVLANPCQNGEVIPLPNTTKFPISPCCQHVNFR